MQLLANVTGANQQACLLKEGLVSFLPACFSDELCHVKPVKGYYQWHVQCAGDRRDNDTCGTELRVDYVGGNPLHNFLHPPAQHGPTCPVLLVPSE